MIEEKYEPFFDILLKVIFVIQFMFTLGGIIYVVKRIFTNIKMPEKQIYLLVVCIYSGINLLLVISLLVASFLAMDVAGVLRSFIGLFGYGLTILGALFIRTTEEY